MGAEAKPNVHVPTPNLAVNPAPKGPSDVNVMASGATLAKQDAHGLTKAQKVARADADRRRREEMGIEEEPVG